LEKWVQSVWKKGKEIKIDMVAMRFTGHSLAK
jgi:hypothetical protein